MLLSHFALYSNGLFVVPLIRSQYSDEQVDHFPFYYPNINIIIKLRIVVVRHMIMAEYEQCSDIPEHTFRSDSLWFYLAFYYFIVAVYHVTLY